MPGSKFNVPTLLRGPKLKKIQLFQRVFHTIVHWMLILVKSSIMGDKIDIKLH